MLSKRILSLSLVAGLTFSSTLSAFAWNDQSETTNSFETKEISTEIINNAATMLMIPACRDYLFSAVNKLSDLAVVAFCYQLKYSNDVHKLTMEFERLYNNDLAFKQAVNEAWVWDISTGNKQHASVQGGVNDSLHDKIKRVGRSTKDNAIDNSLHDKIKRVGRSTKDNAIDNSLHDKIKRVGRSTKDN